MNTLSQKATYSAVIKGEENTTIYRGYVIKVGDEHAFQNEAEIDTYINAALAI